MQPNYLSIVQYNMVMMVPPPCLKSCQNMARIRVTAAKSLLSSKRGQCALFRCNSHKKHKKLLQRTTYSQHVRQATAHRIIVNKIKDQLVSLLKVYRLVAMIVIDCARYGGCTNLKKRSRWKPATWGDHGVGVFCCFFYLFQSCVLLHHESQEKRFIRPLVSGSTDKFSQMI